MPPLKPPTSRARRIRRTIAGLGIALVIVGHLIVIPWYLGFHLAGFVGGAILSAIAVTPWLTLLTAPLPRDTTATVCGVFMLGMQVFYIASAIRLAEDGLALSQLLITSVLVGFVVVALGAVLDATLARRGSGR